jgi:hypothetical protein
MHICRSETVRARALIHRKIISQLINGLVIFATRKVTGD